MQPLKPTTIAFTLKIYTVTFTLNNYVTILLSCFWGLMTGGFL